MNATVIILNATHTTRIDDRAQTRLLPCNYSISLVWLQKTSQPPPADAKPKITIDINHEGKSTRAKQCPFDTPCSETSWLHLSLSKPAKRHRFRSAYMSIAGDGGSLTRSTQKSGSPLLRSFVPHSASCVLHPASSVRHSTRLRVPAPGTWGLTPSTIPRRVTCRRLTANAAGAH